jgi:hypothetical protein
MEHDELDKQSLNDPPGSMSKDIIIRDAADVPPVELKSAVANVKQFIQDVHQRITTRTGTTSMPAASSTPATGSDPATEYLDSLEAEDLRGDDLAEGVYITGLEGVRGQSYVMVEVYLPREVALTTLMDEVTPLVDRGYFAVGGLSILNVKQDGRYLHLLQPLWKP